MPVKRSSGRWLWLLVAGGALALAAFGVGNAAAARAAATTRLVDDDKAQCPNAQYTTIQAAVDAAAPGDTIEVCAGTYSSTTVNKADLRLRGATDALRGERCLDRTRGADPAHDSVVNGAAGSPGFSVAAQNVKIAGFTVQNASGSNGAGVYVPASAPGVDVVRNVLQKNTMGVYLTNDGSLGARVEGNCVRDNNVAGSAAGNGVYSDAGLKKASIAGNVFSGQENAAVILVGAAGSQSDVSVSRNAALKDASFIFANLTSSRVDGNASVESDGSGIFFGGGSSDVRVAGNTIEKCAFTGINVRYSPADYPVSSNNTGLAITGNRVSGCGDAGIRLRDGAQQNLVRENRVSENGTGAVKGDGIALENADSNRVEANRSDRNGRDGMRADVDSSGNAIVRNAMSGNGEHDCHDDSHGSGTAGTANTWSADVGATDQPDGLCSPSGKEAKHEHHEKGEHKEKGEHQPKGEDRHEAKVTVCHRTGNGKFVEITVAAPAARAHMRHGDVAASGGGCPDRAGDVAAARHAKHEAKHDDDDHGRGQGDAKHEHGSHGGHGHGGHGKGHD